MTLGQGKIESRLGVHKQTDLTAPKHSQLRRLFKQVMTELDEILPAGREREKALTELETASMWAHKSVASRAPVIHEEHPTYEGQPESVNGTPEQEAQLRQVLRSLILEQHNAHRQPTETVADFFRRLVAKGKISQADFLAVFPNKSVEKASIVDRSNSELVSLRRKYVVKRDEALKDILIFREFTNEDELGAALLKNQLVSEDEYKAYFRRDELPEVEPNSRNRPRSEATKNAWDRFVEMKKAIIEDGGYGEALKHGDQELARTFYKHGQITSEEFFELFGQWPSKI
jgi:hypothetical protein